MRLAAGLVMMMITAPSLAQDITVVDGDTLRLGDNEVWMWGIDTPERPAGQIVHIWGIAAPEFDQTCPRNSAEFGGDIFGAGALATLTLARRILTIQLCEPAGMNAAGVMLVSCRLQDGLDLGAALVAAGAAWDHAEISAYADEQSSAQAAELGVCSADCLPVWEWLAPNSD